MDKFFNLENCRACFYQWDTNQRLIVTDSSVTEIQFECKSFPRAVPATIYEIEGVRYCKVPQIFLEQSEPIVVYATIQSEKTGYVKLRDEIKIVSRKQPSGYYRQYI